MTLNQPATTAPQHKNACPACRGSRHPSSPVPWPGFAHADLRPFTAPPLIFVHCPTCGLVGRAPQSSDTAPEAIYTSANYAERKPPLAYVRPPETPDVMVPTPLHQVNILRREEVSFDSVLDIGCFDGKFLEFVRQAVPRARLVGYDVNPHCRGFMTDGVAFECSGLDQIDGSFSLITMSHSVQYERDLTTLLGHIDRLLDADGAVFVQVPDFSLRPTTLLFSDLHHQLTLSSLIDVLGLFGFDAVGISGTAFRRDALVLARRGAKPRRPRHHDGSTLNAALGDLHSMAARVARLKDGRHWSVLGTSIESAFAIHLLGDDVVGIIDEAESSQGTDFQGRIVRHPRDLSPDDHVILPLGPHAGTVITRFRETYASEFVLI